MPLELAALEQATRQALAKNKETTREAAQRIRRMADQASGQDGAETLRRYAAELDKRADRVDAAEVSRRKLKEQDTK